MTWDAPWALGGLLALPVIWWVHRRLRRPIPLDLPSLMFLLDEAELHALPRGRRFDAQLVLALTAAACLALGAAGPRWLRAPGRRLVSVVVAGGAPARLTGYEERVQAVLATIRSACAEGDRVEVRWEPSAQASGPRPSTAALLGAARGGRASLRVVVADTEPREDPGDVTWLTVGEPTAVNQGIVAVDVEDEEGGLVVFCNVAHHGAQTATLVLRTTAEGEGAPPVIRRTALEIAPEALRPVSVALPGQPTRIEVALEASGGQAHRDDLALDDQVTLTREPLAVYLDDALPAPHRERARRALEASQGPGGLRWQGAAAGAALSILRRDHPAADAGGWVLELEPVPPGAPTERAGAGDEETGRDGVVADCSSGGVEWVYAPAAARLGPAEELLLARRGAATWPIVVRRGRRVRLAPDPLRGAPAAADAAVWPLLVDNLARLAGGRAAGSGGWRITGLLDAGATRPGRSRRGAFDAGRLRAAPLVEPAAARSLRAPLTLAALACLLLLWAAPWLRPRRRPVERRRAVAAG